RTRWARARASGRASSAESRAKRLAGAGPSHAALPGSSTFSGGHPKALLAPMQRPTPLLRTILLSLVFVACADLRGTERSTVSTSQNVATAHWFRGTPLSLQPVTQGDVVVNTPLANGATISL